MSEKKWYGKKPTTCDVCSRPIEFAFVDGKTKMGPWAIMCDSCHGKLGHGLGVGRGQRYDADSLLKIGG